MLRRHIILLIAIRPSDGDVKPGGPLGAFREEQAMSRHWVSPSPFLSSSSHTTQPQLSPVHYTDTHPTRNVICPSSAGFKNRPHLTPSIHLAWNPKHAIVQWVGIGTHIHTHARAKGIELSGILCLSSAAEQVSLMGGRGGLMDV